MAEARKSPSKKSTAKKSSQKPSTKKAASKKSSARKSSAGQSAPRAEPARRKSGADIAASASRQFAELTTRPVEAVTGLSREDGTWRVELEVLELSRIPSTTDVLATYEVMLSEAGELEGYRRLGRYVRGHAEERS